ncbi:MAG: MFS transporter, partial [Actinobacteria bacterium]|nr:MFS transporter [Actinomycetota bacterium]
MPSDETTSDRRRWVTLAVLCLALLVVGIDGTIVNVALPSLVRELDATSTQLQWIVDAYTIVFAGFLLIAGSTGDRLGRKKCFVIGLTIFGAGSAACALAHDPTSLIVFRGIQGFGAAFIMPATLSILTNTFRDPTERAKAIALWAGVSGLGVAIGPLAGGYLLVHFWWGSIFLVNVPLVGVAIIAALVIVPESRDPQAPRLDLAGTAMSTIGLIGLLFGIIEGPSQGWGRPMVVGGFAIAVVLLTAFVFWERHTDDPLLDLSFFADPRFSAASVAVTLVFFAMFGSVFFVSQYLQFVLGYSAFKSGAALLPVAATLMVAAPLSAKLVAHLGTKIVVATGLAVVALGLYLFAFTTVDSGYSLIAGILVVVGLGMGLAMAPATDSIMGSLPPEKAGVGSAVND